MNKDDLNEELINDHFNQVILTKAEEKVLQL